MVIDKGLAANIVSFCGTGVRKISPTQFEVDYTNFTPTKEVAVLILKHMNAVDALSQDADQSSPTAYTGLDAAWSGPAQRRGQGG